MQCIQVRLIDLESRIEKIWLSIVGVTAITLFFYEALKVMKITKRTDENIFTTFDFNSRGDFTES